MNIFAVTTWKSRKWTRSGRASTHTVTSSSPTTSGRQTRETLHQGEPASGEILHRTGIWHQADGRQPTAQVARGLLGPRRQRHDTGREANRRSPGKARDDQEKEQGHKPVPKANDQGRPATPGARTGDSGEGGASRQQMIYFNNNKRGLSFIIILHTQNLI